MQLEIQSYIVISNRGGGNEQGREERRGYGDEEGAEMGKEEGSWS